MHARHFSFYTLIEIDQAICSVTSIWPFDLWPWSNDLELQLLPW